MHQGKAAGVGALRQPQPSDSTGSKGDADLQQVGRADAAVCLAVRGKCHGGSGQAQQASLAGVGLG